MRAATANRDAPRTSTSPPPVRITSPRAIRIEGTTYSVMVWLSALGGWKSSWHAGRCCAWVPPLPEEEGPVTRRLRLGSRRAAKLATRTGTVPRKDCQRNTAAWLGYTSAGPTASSDHETQERGDFRVFLPRLHSGGIASNRCDSLRGRADLPCVRSATGRKVRASWARPVVSARRIRHDRGIDR